MCLNIIFYICAFTRFLQVAALTNAEIVNYTNIAQECGISAKTVKEYFSILEDTMLGFYLPAFGKEFPNAKRYLLSMEERPRMLNGIEIWPVCQFLSRLWAGKIV